MHNFSAPRTPQQNGVVERKNRSLEELARTMLNEYEVPKYFWADVVSTTCYVLNRMLIRPILKITPYEFFKGRKTNVSSIGGLSLQMQAILVTINPFSHLINSRTLYFLKNLQASLLLNIDDG